MEGLTFPEALKMLGDRVGVEVVFRGAKEQQQQKTEKENVLRVNLLCAKYFKAVLWSKEGKQALDYLTSRGLSPEIIEKFKIGYANDPSKLSATLAKYKVGFADLAKAGHPERFRYRIMFPIFDTLGNIVGFSGRILESALPEGLSPHPKYLNTPETAVFHKSRILYGLHLAKNAIREQASVVVVEGQMDVISSHIGGVENVVASSGTALTQDHLKIISRLSSNIVFSFDEDEAGQKAALSAVPMALDLSLEPKLTIIEKYKDVGELVEKEPASWKLAVKSALPPVEWLVARATKARQGDNFSAPEKKELVKKALAFISRMTDEIEKAHYISYIAKVVGVPAETVEKALSKSPRKSSPSQDAPAEPQEDIEAKILSGLIYHPKLFSDKSLYADIKFTNGEYAEVYKEVEKCYNKPSQELSRDLLDVLKRVTDRQQQEVFAVYALEWDKKIEENQKDAIQEFVDFKRKIVQTKKEETKSDYATAIAQAEAKGDLSKLKKLMEELQEKLKN
jgi:DNA primase